MDTECTREDYLIKVALLRLYIKYSHNRMVFFTNYFSNFRLITDWLLPELNTKEFKDTSVIPALLESYDIANLSKILHLSKKEILKHTIIAHLESTN